MTTQPAPTRSPSIGTADGKPSPRPLLSEAALDAIADRLADRLSTIPTAPPPLLTSTEVADWLNVSERTVDNLVALGELVPVRVTPSGRGRRFERRGVEAFIRRCAGRRS